jgi:hypothetical protein
MPIVILITTLTMCHFKCNLRKINIFHQKHRYTVSYYTFPWNTVKNILLRRTSAVFWLDNLYMCYSNKVEFAMKNYQADVCLIILRRPRLIAQTEASLILHIMRKLNSIIVLLYLFKKIPVVANHLLWHNSSLLWKSSLTYCHIIKFHFNVMTSLR